MARPKVFTIPPDVPFLNVLAQAVLDGFPDRTGSRPTPLEIARVIILLPTRRAARELARIFFDINGGRGLLLPRISPIGDIDEELFGFLDSPSPLMDVMLPGAISSIGRELLLVDLISEWARENPQESLAIEIGASPRQAVSLAVSLAEFLDSLEIEDIEPARIAELYGVEAARHREAILGFLSLIREKLPARLKERELMGPMARRSLMLRREAERLAESDSPWPVIAAGSTGSIPASRKLLGTIAHLPKGAVVLPGLDTGMDHESWEELSPQHPQFIVKQFLAGISVSREDVKPMPGSSAGPKAWLASEIMRPPATAEKWRGVVSDQKKLLAQALENITMIEARGVAEEAAVISLILRQVLETPGKTASLVTPDRKLARRVKQELANRSIDIDDSAGEPLIGLGSGAFLSLLLDTAVTGFRPEKLLALFKHDLCRFGFEPAAARRAVSVIELAVFRRGFGASSLAQLAEAIVQAQIASKSDPHLPPAIRNFTESDWKVAVDYANRAATCLLPLTEGGEARLETHLAGILRACELAAGDLLLAGEEARTLHTLLAGLLREEGNLAACSLAMAADLLHHCMAITLFRRTPVASNNLTILGPLESRLMGSNLVILGGLNEGRWPSPPDPGPWLNRPMREILGIEQPERRIGQAAHDFVQALGCDEVYLTWSRRVDGAPSLPSRWIMRLQMLAKAASLDGWLAAGQTWQSLADALDELHAPAVPCKRPKPRPPVAARPKRLSVTRIETLVRDPYEIYSKQVLGLVPLEDLSSAPGMAERGSLFHQAIGDFLKAFPQTLPADALDHLLRLGREHFALLASHTDVETFWWPQFERIARWFIPVEIARRRGVARTYSEIDGRLELSIAGEPFILTCRADRIDVLENGSARIVDYKTGKIPSHRQVELGLAPQLTLEAAMLAEGAFPSIGKRLAQEIEYVKLSGGHPPGEVTVPDLGQEVMDCARKHLEYLVSLLTAYANPNQAYFPRAMMEKEDDESDYDHFSRYREWALS